MASAQAIQASCQAAATQKDDSLESVMRYVAGALQTRAASKICDSLISCAPHKK
jgi:hypothetical protein